MTFDADLTACAAIVEKGDPERFAAAMASPVEARRVLFPLYAFNVEVSRAPWVTQEPMIAEMRLQWWRDALEEIADGKPVRRHEVVTPLSKVLSPDGARRLDRVVAARRWDIYKDPFEDAAHFDAYLSDTAGGLMHVAAQSLSDQEGFMSVEGIKTLGYAVGLSRFLQAIPELEAQKRIPLVDGRADAIAALAFEALRRCAARGRRGQLLPSVRPAVTEAFLATAILKQAAKSPERVAQGSLSVHPVKRSYLLWRWSRP
ncbi:MAG: squalene/phytoene synthase family protein [Roseobacter sp.]